MSIDWNALREPFAADEIEWRVGNKNKRGDRATLLCYLTSRAVQDRLDRVLEPGGWRDSYEPIFEGNKLVGFLCTLEINVDGTWLGKTDVSDTTDIEALKGGISGALKRAAVKWGIGRYLYGVDSRYHPIKDGYGPDGAIYVKLDGNKPGHIVPPQLPAWALPGGSGSPNASANRPAARPTARTEPSPPQAANEPEASASALVLAKEGAGNDRASRLRTRIAQIESQLDHSIIEQVRTSASLPLNSDLSEAGADSLLAYGKALAAAAPSEAA